MGNNTVTLLKDREFAHLYEGTGVQRPMIVEEWEAAKKCYDEFRGLFQVLANGVNNLDVLEAKLNRILNCTIEFSDSDVIDIFWCSSDPIINGVALSLYIDIEDNIAKLSDTFDVELPPFAEYRYECIYRYATPIILSTKEQVETEDIKEIHYEVILPYTNVTVLKTLSELRDMANQIYSFSYPTENNFFTGDNDNLSVLTILKKYNITVRISEQESRTL